MIEKMMLIDSHAHLTGEALYPHLESILERAQQAGVNQIVNICTDRASLERGIEAASRYPWISLAGATTPHDVDKLGELEFDLFAQCAREGKLQAVGETGLDYHYFHSTKEKQQSFLRRYLQLALEYRLPVVIHCREAFADLFRILDEEYVVNGKHAPGVLHCFTGTIQEAEEVVKRGWMLSLSGIVTFKKSTELHEVAKRVPLKNLLIETDSPYLAPQTKRGQTNEPAYLVETAQFISHLKQIPLEDLAQATSHNARTLFRM